MDDHKKQEVKQQTNREKTIGSNIKQVQVMSESIRYPNADKIYGEEELFER